MDLKIRASASPAVGFLSDKVNVGRVVERIDAKAFLGPGDYKRAVLGAPRIGTDLELWTTWLRNYGIGSK